MSKQKDYFNTYMQNHRTLLLATKRLLERRLDESEWSQAESLEPMRVHVQRELDALEALMARHGLEESAATDALVWLGEKLGKLKLNGHLASRSPLSEVTELEALALTSQARMLFWRSLADTPPWTQTPETIGEFEHHAQLDCAQCSSLHGMALRRALDA